MEQVTSHSVRLVIANCRVDCAAVSPPTCRWPRLILVKSDGTVLIHSDSGSYKPLNWMSPPCRVVEGTNDDGVVVDRHRQGRHAADPARGRPPRHRARPRRRPRAKDGVEKHLQELLAEHPATLAEGLTLVRREYPTAIGPVDLMCRDARAPRSPWRSSGAARSTAWSS